MKEAYDFLYHDLNLKYKDTVVAGISGGPDSMVLLSLLIKLKKSLDITIICAHVNHNVRKESKDELIFVQDYCNKHGVIFESMVIENYGDDNFHNEARHIRYRYFEQLVEKYHAKYLFTAHHGDDLMETILMRMVRGSTLKGYSGFSKTIEYPTYKIVRPLIHVTKSQIEEYANSHKIPYVVDSSNHKDKYTRNRFRKYILPKLKEEDPLVHEKFYKFSQTLLECNEYIEKQVKKIISQVYPQNVLNVSEFLKQDEFMQKKILYYILEKYYQDDLMLLTDRHVELFHQLIISQKSNAVIHLPNNIEATKAYDTVQLSEIKEKPSDYEIELTEYVNLPNGKNMEIIKNSQKDGNDICRLDSREIKLPLYIRNKKDGDKMTVKGMLGSKKISDIFIDCKVKSEDRLTWPIVCDANNEIVWLPGLKKSKFCKEKDGKYDIIIKYY